MSNTNLNVVVGSFVSNAEVFRNVLDGSEDFRTHIKDIFDDRSTSIATWEQFYEFIRDGASENNKEKWTKERGRSSRPKDDASDSKEKWTIEEHGELCDVYNDWIHDLANYEYTCPSGNKVKIIRVPHDCATDKHVIGKIVQTIEKSGMLEIDTEKLNEIREDLEDVCELDNIKVFRMNVPAVIRFVNITKD